MKKLFASLFSVTLMSVALVGLLQACGPVEPDDWDDAGFTDAGSTDSATALTCADYEGQNCTDTDECHGDLLVWCNNGTTVCDDCATMNGGPFHCAEWTQSHGNDCLAGANQACTPDFPDNSDLVGCDPLIGTCTNGVCQ